MSDFDEEKWLAENPRPNPGLQQKDMTPDQMRAYKAWIARKLRAGFSRGTLPPDEGWDEDAWLAENPRPHPSIKIVDMTQEQAREYDRWVQKKKRDKSRKFLNAKRSEQRKADPSIAERQAARHKERYATDEDYRERRLARYRERYASDPTFKARDTARQSKRIASLLQRTMAWGNEAIIDEFYKIRAEITELTGTRHEVDHVIPLQGAKVSGLHVENNLRVISYSENGAKWAHFTPGQRIPAGGIKKARALLQKVQQEQTLEPA